MCSLNFFSLTLLISLLFEINIIFAKHIHSHVNKERVEDGAYHPFKYLRRDSEDKTQFDHEAIVGSVEEAEEFHHLSEEESKKRLAILITKMDTNGDEYVEPKELSQWIIQSLSNISDKDVADSFEDVDLNNDGKITWEEQLADSFDTNADNAEITIESDDKILITDKKLFEAADLDKDGSLDKAEYKRFLCPEEFPDMLPIIIENTLILKDIDKNGAISLPEFLDNSDEAGLMHMSDDDHGYEENTFHNLYDKNKDGVLSDEEILNWVVPNSTELAIQETERLFGAADYDHDGKLSFTEILDNHGMFVGSQVTDFGNDLEDMDFNDEL